MWPVPAGRLGAHGSGDLWPVLSCPLFLRSVGHASHGPRQLAWPGSESCLSHKWKHQTGRLKAWPWFLHGTRFFSVYPAGLSCPTYFIVGSTDSGRSVRFPVNLLPLKGLLTMSLTMLDLSALLPSLGVLLFLVSSAQTQTSL